MLLKQVLILGVVLCCANAISRCSFGGWACRGFCSYDGLVTGMCTPDYTCHCATEYLNITRLQEQVPRACEVGITQCNTACKQIGKDHGVCGGNGCTCSDEWLSDAAFRLCEDEDKCEDYCYGLNEQVGNCEGWNCVCHK
ncbi:teneurin-1 [Eurytemora carolleeae]|uniref:teneurin-1 n=1 Tax=Eurytemora carolleeae TaxID=1294199 RepID=UPI000C788CDE|nr:teneurin-1 [Eurytemora carolleeae]|eukprot:XP_023341012.1 teneurin-1-like [Eurytemora affinis]